VWHVWPSLKPNKAIGFGSASGRQMWENGDVEVKKSRISRSQQLHDRIYANEADADIEAKVYRDKSTDDEIFFVSVSKLSMPADFLIRELDQKYISQLAASIKERPKQNPRVLPAFIDVEGDNDPITKENFHPDDLKKDFVIVYNLGGNHFREACNQILDSLADQDQREEQLKQDVFQNVAIKVYFDLTTTQKLRLAASDNQISQKPMIWIDECFIMREYLKNEMKAQNVTVEKDKPLTFSDKLNLHMNDVLNGPVEVDNKLIVSSFNSLFTRSTTHQKPDTEGNGVHKRNILRSIKYNDTGKRKLQNTFASVTINSVM
jgi:hypothetical protein